MRSGFLMALTVKNVVVDSQSIWSAINLRTFLNNSLPPCKNGTYPRRR